MLRNVIVPEIMSLYSMDRMTAPAPSPTVNSLGTDTTSFSPVGSPVEGSTTSTVALTLSRDAFRSLSQLVAVVVDAVGISVLSTAIPR